jgi:hypothetical protein
MMTTTNRPHYWMGPVPCKCDVCNQGFSTTFFDCKTKFGGRWGNLCPTCRELHGPAQLGTGYGQRYDLQADGRYMKTEG